MLKKVPIPPSFSLVRRGKTFLLLRDDFKDLLLKKGIENPETLFRHPLFQGSFMKGRTPHPVIALEEGRRIVLRKYSHGGLLRALTQDLFIAGARSFRELVLTEEVRSVCIPTIEPIGAVHRVILWPLYRAYFLSLEVAGAKNLVDYFQERKANPSPEALSHKRRVIRSAGQLLRLFHQEGFYHRDLQLKNLLVADDQVLIIDLDCCCRRRSLSMRRRIANLLRLNRSVDKWKRFGLPLTRTDRWRFFRAYAENDPQLLRAMKEALRTYRLRLILHRIGWLFEEMIRRGQQTASFRSDP